MTRIGGQNWAFFAAIRGPNGPSSEDDITAKIMNKMEINENNDIYLLHLILDDWSAISGRY